MNWKNLFFISTFGWLGILLLTQCTKEVPAPPAQPTVLLDTLRCGPTTEDERCDKIPHQMATYAAFLDSLSSMIPDIEPIEPNIPTVPVLTQELLSLKGFRFHAEELAWIAQQAQAQDSMVYVMLAVNDDPRSVDYRQSMDSPILYLDVYFQVVTPEGEPVFFRPDSILRLNDYADFPQPCPPSCPKDPS